MEKFLVFVMVVAVGIISGILLLNNVNQQNNSSANLNLGSSPSVSSPSPQSQQQTRPATTIVTEVPPLDLVVAKQAIVATNKGSFTIQLNASEAAQTVSHFAQKATSGFYTGLTFHRVEDWVVQGGDPKGDGTGGNDMFTELNNQPFVSGSVGIAGHQGQDGKIINNDSQFFITKTDASWLNGAYTNFGVVISGMDVVDKLQIGDKITSITIE